jgi:AraC-like DNA-binding protein
MDNRYFNDTALARLCLPAQWQVVSRYCPGEVAPVEHAGHQRWMREHGHSHAHLELLCFLDGHGRHGYHRQVYLCQPGTMLLFEAFAEHDQNCPPDAPDADHLWVAITRDHLVARALTVRGGRIQFPPAWNVVFDRQEPRLHEAFDLIDLEKQQQLPAPFLRLRVISAIAAILSVLIAEGFHAARADAPGDAQRRIVATVCRHIQDTAGNGASLESLARLAGYSKYHFLRLFAAHTGQSVHAYIDACRRRVVREMLAAGSSKKAIASRLGFSCPASFSRWLRQHREILE